MKNTIQKEFKCIWRKENSCALHLITANWSVYLKQQKSCEKKIFWILFSTPQSSFDVNKGCEIRQKWYILCSKHTTVISQKSTRGNHLLRFTLKFSSILSTTTYFHRDSPTISLFPLKYGPLLIFFCPLNFSNDVHLCSPSRTACASSTLVVWVHLELVFITEKSINPLF